MTGSSSPDAAPASTLAPVADTLPVSVQSALRRYWGFSQLRSPQADVIRALLRGRDALVVLPTGFGKSLCFQLPAIVQSGTTLVISPLIALMEDQAMGLRQRGLMAEALHGQCDRQRKRRILSQLEQGQLALLYLSPEMLLHSSVWRRLQQSSVKIAGTIIDEAHTVAEWGQSFRPAYMRLGAIRRGLGQRFSVSAFTATANGEIQTVLQDVLELQNPLVIRASPRRENIRISVKIAWTVAGRRKQLMDFVRHHRGHTGLVYCRTRELCQELAEMLSGNGLSTAAYHGGVGCEQRRQLEQQWLAGDRDFLVCTNAFGMGVDCARVRWVIHFQPPANVTDYVQEIGRAGRDGQPANTLMLVSEPTGLLDSSDRQRWQYMQRQQIEAEQQARRLLPHLPERGTYDDAVQQSSTHALSLAVLRRSGDIRWDDPFQFSRTTSSRSTPAFGTKHKRRSPQDRASSIQAFIGSKQCRWQAIETTLGYNASHPCKVCDNCRAYA
ncbi:MAG: RecQ family ATP-dependent DNA helicase [Cyanobacteria bacterium J06597_1]